MLSPNLFHAFAGSLCLLSVLVSCTTTDSENQQLPAPTPPPATSVRPDSPVDAQVVEDPSGGKTLWLVDGESNQPVQLLIGDQSQEIVPHFSPDKQWLLVEELMFSNIQTVRLFHRSAEGSFLQVPNEQITGPLWEEFQNDHPIELTDLVRTAVRMIGWSEDSLLITLGLMAERADHSRIEELYQIDLAILFPDPTPPVVEEPEPAPAPVKKKRWFPSQAPVPM